MFQSVRGCSRCPSGLSIWHDQNPSRSKKSDVMIISFLKTRLRLDLINQLLVRIHLKRKEGRHSKKKSVITYTTLGAPRYSVNLFGQHLIYIWGTPLRIEDGREDERFYVSVLITVSTRRIFWLVTSIFFLTLRRSKS